MYVKVLKPGEGVRSPSTGITGNCELPNKGVENGFSSRTASALYH